MPKDCTCVGTCRGPDELGEGWACVLQPSDTPRDHLILSLKWSRGSENLVWYRPKSCGYTEDLDRAGRYTREEAQRACDGSEGDVAPVRVEDAYAVALRPVLVEASEANVERLTIGHAVRLNGGKGAPP